MGNFWKHRTFRTVLDPDSEEYGNATMNQKVGYLKKCLEHNLGLEELVSGYKEFYREEKKPHVIASLEEGLLLIFSKGISEKRGLA